MKKVFKNSSGFSLLEATIGVALLGLSLIAVMQLSSTTSSEAKDLAMATSQYRNIISRVNSILSNPTFCRLALGGADSETSVPVIGQPGGGLSTADQSINLYEPKFGGGGTIYIQPTVTTIGIWKITALTIKSTTAIPPLPGVAGAMSNPVPAELTIRMERTGASGTVTREWQKINISVRLSNTGKIQACSGITYATDDHPVPVCTGANEGLRSTGTRLECRKVKCTPPTSPNGVDANGDIICL